MGRKFERWIMPNELYSKILGCMIGNAIGDLPSLQWARQRLIPEIITKGNIPLNVLLNGTEEEVRSEVRKVKEETQGYRHIVGLSDDVLHNTPLSNCLALVDEARRQ
jgi:uroporphyrinogen-III decarboxylase